MMMSVWCDTGFRLYCSSSSGAGS